MTNAYQRPAFSRSRRLLTIGAVALMAGATLPAPAQTSNWPTKPVRLIVGFAPGGSTDVMARVLAQLLTESIGQPVIVENKPGASGNIAASEVMRTTPDGYTFMVAPTSVETANPSLFKSNVLPSRDLTPVMGFGRSQMYLIARPDFPAKDVKQLIELAKTQPGKLAYASSGAGTPLHLAGELFKQSTGTFITHVPYRGSGPAVQDVAAGQVDLNFDSGVSFPFIKTGKVKLLAVASNNKSSFFPEAPTYTDLGIKNASLDIWFGIWAPNNTPADISAKLQSAVATALANPGLKERFATLGAVPSPLENTAFRKLLAEESAMLTELIKARGIAAE